MLPIPKELQGTKAIPFMEWYICYYNNYGGTMDVITDFYSQPFTPEMLQEYFEGFYENGRNNYELLTKREEQTYVSATIYKSTIYKWRVLSSIIDINNTSIKNLDELIIELNKIAGVELTWKGE